MGSGYNVGAVGDGVSQGFSPLDLRNVQEKFIEGSITPNMMISFGKDFDSENKITAADDNMSGSAGKAVLDNAIYLYDMKCAFQTPTLGLRTQNLHRSGATSATPAWCIIPKCRASVFLMSRLHTNVIDKITVFHLAYIGADHANTKPVVTETRCFEDCLVTYLEPFGHGDFTVFAFSFVKLTWAIKDFQQGGQNAKNKEIGQQVYVFDYSGATGTLS